MNLIILIRGSGIRVKTLRIRNNGFYTQFFIIGVRVTSPTLGWGGSPLLDAGEVHLANPSLRLNVRTQTNWRRLRTSAQARTDAAWNKRIFYWIIVIPQHSIYQCCGSGMFIPDPGSDFFPSRIPDPNCLHPGSRILIKEFKQKKQKNGF